MWLGKMRVEDLIAVHRAISMLNEDEMNPGYML